MDFTTQYHIKFKTGDYEIMLRDVVKEVILEYGGLKTVQYLEKEYIPKCKGIPITKEPIKIPFYYDHVKTQSDHYIDLYKGLDMLYGDNAISYYDETLIRQLNRKSDMESLRFKLALQQTTLEVMMSNPSLQ